MLAPPMAAGVGPDYLLVVPEAGADVGGPGGDVPAGAE